MTPDPPTRGGRRAQRGAALLPPNSTAFERALDSVLGRLGEVPLPIADMWSPERCPEAALPLLAEALAVEEWGADWPVEVRRAVLARAVEVHRLKGTPAAVKRLLEGIGAVYDYAEPRPLHFAVTIYNSAALVLDDRASLSAAIDGVKRASARCSLTVHAGLRGEARIAAGAAARVVVELGAAPRSGAAVAGGSAAGRAMLRTAVTGRGSCRGRFP